MGLLLNLKIEDEVTVGDVIIKVTRFKGKQVRLKFDGPKDIKINRIFKESASALQHGSSSQINQHRGAEAAHLKDQQ